MTHEIFKYEDDDRIIIERLRLSDEEAIKLSIERCVSFGGHTWFRKDRCDNILIAQQRLQPGEIIAEARTAVFILTLNQDECQRAPQAHMGIKPFVHKKSYII